jgi:hypothetical protein
VFLCPQIREGPAQWREKSQAWDPPVTALSVVYLVILQSHRVHHRNAIVRAAVAAFLLAVPMVLAACGAGAGNSAISPVAASSSTRPSVAGGLTSTATPPPTAVSDSDGATFEVSASHVEAALVVNVNSFLWSAAPGQSFLVDTLMVKNPTAGIETLSDFDDLTSGLAKDVMFVMNASDAAPLGYSSDCGIDAAYPPPLCTISFGQGLTVDDDSADHDNRSAVMLSPGSTAQITLSYGPVLTNLAPTMVSVYFDGGSSAPTELAP